MNHFLRAPDAATIARLLDAAAAYKRDPERDAALGAGKTLVQLYMNPSLRTRLSTTLAAQRLGMRVQTLDTGSGWALEFADGVRMDGAKAEHVREAAAVISQYADVIALRTFAQLTDPADDASEPLLTAFARHAGRPLLSLESATRHPLQSLADLLTIRELRRSERPRIVLTWAPHPRALPQAVANSFAEWTLAAGYDLTIARPPECALDESFAAGARQTDDQNAALADADFVYVKNWSATDPYGQVVEGRDDWRITAEKLHVTNGARVMHCLPVRRGVVIDHAVLDSAASAVIQQAGNRQWAAQAALGALLQGTEA